MVSSNESVAVLLNGRRLHQNCVLMNPSQTPAQIGKREADDAYALGIFQPSNRPPFYWLVVLPIIG